MHKALRLIPIFCLIALVNACARPVKQACVNEKVHPLTQQIMVDIKYLSSDVMAGRAVGSLGSKLARNYIITRFKNLGISPFQSDYSHVFHHNKLKRRKGTNIVAQIQGTHFPEKHIVISAHYDHLGQKYGQIFHGADDNASGVALMLALAQWLMDNPPQYTIVFLASDAEEQGLLGAKSFLANTKQRILANVNIDMVGRARRNYFVSSSELKQPLKAAIVGKEQCITYRRLHNMPQGRGKIDYLRASDHFAFAKAQIPFVFISGPIHDDYHLPSDRVNRIKENDISLAFNNVRLLYRHMLKALTEVK